MFIATMFSYGKDGACVGVDGIRTCMGVFLSYRGTLYAIHVPASNQDRLDQGRAAFVGYVQREAGALVPKDARLYVVLNGNERSSAKDEVMQYARDLGLARFTMARAHKHLGPNPQYQDAAAFLCHPVPGSADCILKYQRAEDVRWVKNAGTARAGHYFNASFTDVLSTDPAPIQGWYTVDPPNGTVEVVTVT